MEFQYKGIPVYYTDTGKGSVVVLIHGFLEDHSMWDSIVKVLQQTHRVITVDVLGHGKTGCLGYVHTMEDQAEMVYAVLKSLRLRRYHVIGHSMGGYIALAFSKLYTEHIKGLCLLNSTCFSDDNERKNLRDRGVKMAQTNLQTLISMSFANLFSEASRSAFKIQYKKALNVALGTSKQGYIAAQEGMKLRSDLSRFFSEAPFKKAIFLGKKDGLLPFETLLSFANTFSCKTELFSEGHMSHIENEQECISAIKAFIRH